MFKNTKELLWMLLVCIQVYSYGQTHPMLFFGNSDKTAIQEKNKCFGDLYATVMDFDQGTTGGFL
jgi:hypothetical protein